MSGQPYHTKVLPDHSVGNPPIPRVDPIGLNFGVKRLAEKRVQFRIFKHLE
jgi:hypothetical protein